MARVVSREETVEKAEEETVVVDETVVVVVVVEEVGEKSHSLHSSLSQKQNKK